jgi:hypothetical protein
VALECVLNALTPEEIVRVLAEVSVWILEHLRLTACDDGGGRNALGAFVLMAKGKRTVVNGAM